MEPVFHAVSEIIAVDGDSTDGTKEVLQEFCKLRLNATLISMRKGLYEGWNLAVAKSSQPWVYFSTIGDWITLDGLTKLMETSKSLDSDVTISPPRIVEGEGRLPSNFKWPIHHLVESLETKSVSVLYGNELLPWAVGLLPSSLLGSSASNLYRSQLFKKHPFPLGFGHAGDTAWFVDVCRNIRCVIIPEEVADFYWQEKKSDKNPADKWELIKKLQDYALQNKSIKITPHQVAWLKSHFENQASPWSWLASLADLPEKYEEILHYNKLMREELSRTFPKKLAEFIRRKFLCH